MAWFARRRGVPDLGVDGVLPTLGSKEMVALLPALLGLGEGDVVVHPRAAYPTYDVGARLAGATPVPAGEDLATWPERARLVWLNSPGNPDGHVLGVDQLAAVVAWARERGAVVASDECYAELPWRAPWTSDGVPSLLDPRVSGGDHRGLLVLYSLSKQSNLAGLPRGVRGRRPGAGGTADRGAQARRDDRAVPRPGRHDRRPGRRRARRRPSASATAPAARCCSAPSRPPGWSWTRPPPPACTCGCAPPDATTSAPGSSSTPWPTAASSWRPAPSTAPHGDGYVRVALTATDERVAAAAERLSGGGRLF